MKPPDNIEGRIRNVKIDTNSQINKIVLDDLLQAFDKSKAGKVVQKETNIWRIIVNNKITRRVAVLCCLALVSVAAAMVVVPGVYPTCRSFLSALAGRKIGELVELSDPASAVPRQMLDLRDLEIGFGSELELVAMYVDENAAIAVTSNVVIEEEDRQGPLVITLIRRGDMWLVTDIDLETEATVNDELAGFFEYHPDAVEIVQE